MSIDELMIADTSEITLIMAFYDVDSSGDISYAEAASQGWLEHTRKEQAYEVWKHADPDLKYVVSETTLSMYTSDIDWLPTDFWDGIDANNDGLISAQEACIKTGFWDCEDLPNEEPIELEFGQEFYEGFCVDWYRVDRNQDEWASYDDLRAQRSALWSDIQVKAEFTFHDRDGD